MNKKMNILKSGLLRFFVALLFGIVLTGAAFGPVKAHAEDEGDGIMLISEDSEDVSDEAEINTTSVDTTSDEAQSQMLMMLILGGGLIIIIAVVITVVSSTVASVASAVEDEEE